jgi:predicted DNA-binding transcriptional regulator AlpA
MKTDDEALAQFDSLPDSAFVRMPVVAALNGGVPPQTIYRWIKEGRHPAPVKLGAQVSAWNVGAMRRHLASKVAA